MAGFLSLFNAPVRVVVADGFWVDMKTGLSAEDYENAQRALLGKMTMTGDGLRAEPDAIAYQHELVFCAIKDWNLTDEDGVMLPLTPAQAKHDSIRKLPQSVFTDLYGRINDASTPRSRDEQVSFRDGGENRDNGRGDFVEVSDTSEVSN